MLSRIRQRWRWALAAAIVAVLAATAPALADDAGAVRAAYRVVDSRDAGDGTQAVTLRLTLTNLGAAELTGLRLELIGAVLPLARPGQSLAVGDVAAGATVEMPWVIATYSPWDQAAIQPGAMTLLASAVGADGAAIAVVVSEAGGGQ